MDFKLTLDDTASAISVAARRPALVCTVDGARHRVAEGRGARPGATDVRIDDRTHEVWRVCTPGRVHVRMGGRTFSVAYEDAITAAAHQAASADAVHADMPGIAVAVHCAAGALVAIGDALLTIESMKMQITIAAPRAGIIGAIHVTTNESFQKGTLLVSLEPQAEP